MNLKNQRQIYDLTGRKLRRARHLFVLLNLKGHITTTIDLRRAACCMISRGFYSEQSAEKDIRYAILRRLWKLDGGLNRPWPNPNDWHHWLERNGWMIGSWGNRWVKEAQA